MDDDMFDDFVGNVSAVEHQTEDDSESIAASTLAASSVTPTTMTAPVELPARSWVYVNGWATKRRLDEVNFEILRKFPGCKKVYKVKKGSTGNITDHLKGAHKLTKKHVNDGKL
ncbi:hypothetical protein BGZ67_001290, partial [Mortierella alpina]